MNRLSYNASASPDSWVQRVDAACQLIEQRFGISLSKAHSGSKHQATTKLIKNRKKYLQDRLKTVNRWFCFYSGNGHKRTESGFKNVDYFAVGGTMNPDAVSYRIEIELPDDVALDLEKLKLDLHAALQEAQQGTAGDVRNARA